MRALQDERYTVVLRRKDDIDFEHKQGHVKMVRFTLDPRADYTNTKRAAVIPEEHATTIPEEHAAAIPEEHADANMPANSNRRRRRRSAAPVSPAAAKKSKLG